MTHTFHIPVLGLAFSIDTPQKVARYGISSVISVVDDELIERMRKYYCEQEQFEYNPISPKEEDARAKRITAYLDLVHNIVSKQMDALKCQEIATSSEIAKYIDLLPNDHQLKNSYKKYFIEIDNHHKKLLEKEIRSGLQAGAIDINIMSKVDKINFDSKGNQLDNLYSDASAALRGFANSTLKSSVVLSAGMNPRLYTYLRQFPAFLPNEQGQFDKKITLKVSDYRSAMIQAKFLAKKGIWISEFRIESGLNCGGHAFATDGYLIGPILEEFAFNRENLITDLFPLYQKALVEKGINISTPPSIKLTAQGGVGTAAEQDFLLKKYGLDSIGWGSPFLLVPEATTVDKETLQNLSRATEEDFYISDASPLGVPFNNFRNCSAEEKRLERIHLGRPGAPCTKKYLATNSEYTEEPICTASRVYQYTKIKELEASYTQTDTAEYSRKLQEITAKTCLCEGLATSAYIKYDILKRTDKHAVAICPGPNTAYFNGIYSLKEMVNHIYGRTDLLKDVERPSLFINELQLYVAHLEKYIEKQNMSIDDKKIKYVQKFKEELYRGMEYYKTIDQQLFIVEEERITFINQLNTYLTRIEAL